MQNNEDDIFRMGKEMVKATSSVIDETEKFVDKTAVQLERTVAPVRESILKRFPTLFLLAVTFGVTATITGMEQLLIQYDVLQKHPIVILGLGVSILIITGRLYKKLG